jgi:hypothetical protein
MTYTQRQKLGMTKIFPRTLGPSANRTRKASRFDDRPAMTLANLDTKSAGEVEDSASGVTV